ncbi:MAG: YbbR-like domain-containing protein [Candidatus Aminicenantes bacterium]|nr:MAG: YbbR-like domain-containing protein [Candidatus Aminicenantes bacterium]
MKRFFKTLFIRNWGLKLFSFLLALLLWFTLIPEEKMSSEKTLTIQLELHNIPSDMELVQKPPSTIDVKIKAPNRLISQITPANVHAILNLEKARIDQREYPLNNSMISIPQGAEVKDILPSHVNLRFEPAKEIMLDVVPNIIGKLKEGLKLEMVSVIPSQVLIKGPESKVKEDYKVRTSPVDISLLTETTELEADLILPDPDLRLASSQTRVKVRILIQEEPAEKKKEAEKKEKEEK